LVLKTEGNELQVCMAHLVSLALPPLGDGGSETLSLTAKLSSPPHPCLVVLIGFHQKGRANVVKVAEGTQGFGSDLGSLES
jgi:hypothetical protein